MTIVPPGSLARTPPPPDLILPLDSGGGGLLAFPPGSAVVQGPVPVLARDPRGRGSQPPLEVTIGLSGFEPASAPAPSVPAWQGRSIGTTKLRLVEFSAFLEQQRDPDSVSVLRGVP